MRGLPLPLHRPPQSPQPSQKDNNPSPCTTTLASLVKGRWLDGTTQTVALLRPTCDMSALFILQTFLPSRRRDCLSCIDPLHPHNHCKKTIVPCSALNLSPLSKVRCCRPKEFGRLPEGLSHQPFAPHHPFKNRTILRKSPTLLPYERSVGFASLRNSGRSTSGIHARPLSKARCCRPKEFGRLPEELSHQPFAPHQPFKNRTIPPTFRRARGLPLPLHRSY